MHYFPTETKRRLIKYAIDYPVLYDTKQKCKDRVLINNIWKEIRTRLNTAVSLKSLECRWAEVLRQYRKYLKYQNNNIFNYNWKWASAMAPYRPFMDKNYSVSNDSVRDDSVSNDNFIATAEEKNSEIVLNTQSNVEENQAQKESVSTASVSNNAVRTNKFTVIAEINKSDIMHKKQPNMEEKQSYKRKAAQTDMQHSKKLKNDMNEMVLNRTVPQFSYMKNRLKLIINKTILQGLSTDENRNTTDIKENTKGINLKNKTLTKNVDIIQGTSPIIKIVNVIPTSSSSTEHNYHTKCETMVNNTPKQTPINTVSTIIHSTSLTTKNVKVNDLSSKNMNTTTIDNDNDRAIVSHDVTSTNNKTTKDMKDTTFTSEITTPKTVENKTVKLGHMNNKTLFDTIESYSQPNNSINDNTMDSSIQIKEEIILISDNENDEEQSGGHLNSENQSNNNTAVDKENIHNTTQFIQNTTSKSSEAVNTYKETTTAANKTQSDNSSSLFTPAKSPKKVQPKRNNATKSKETDKVLTTSTIIFKENKTNHSKKQSKTEYTPAQFTQTDKTTHTTAQCQESDTSNMNNKQSMMRSPTKCNCEKENEYTLFTKTRATETPNKKHCCYHNQTANSGKPKYTSTELIFLGYAKILESMQPTQKLKAKIEIADIIMKEELLNVQKM